MSGYAPEELAGAFDRSRELFEVVIAGLEDPGTGHLTHGELEEKLTVRARELMRCLLQDHLDLRAAREVRAEAVVGGDGVVRTRVETGRGRQLATVFGEVTVARMAYRAPGAGNLYPADRMLNLPEGKHSHGLSRIAAIESVRGSFDDAAVAIVRATGVKIGKRQVQQMATAAASDVAGFYDAGKPGPSPGDLLVLTYDGKGVVMRPEALRDATARAAATTGRKLATRLSPGEKHGRKRMAEIGAVYDAAPVPRTPADIISRPGRRKGTGTGGGGDQAGGPERSRGPVACGKWLTASLTHDLPTVIAAGFDEAERRDPDHTRAWIALVDGNNTQIEAIKTEAEHRGVPVQIVCDFIHVLEYLWKAAWTFFYPGDADAEEWVADQATKILAGKAADVAAGIRRRATRSGYSPAERKGADQAASYLTSKKPYLDYAHALAQGWPIATGIIEGACRHLVQDRMDLTGARWGLPGAEAILTLRALTSNNDFDAYWNWHLKQEQQRVHHTRYRDNHAFALAA